jgi:dipeptidyl aminopeptidase/acylaminoacyl peptidase
VPRPQGTDLDRFTSLAASADGRRIVATRANPKGTVWRLRPGATATAPPAMSLVPLPTGRGFSPRLAAGFLAYIAPKPTGDAVWKMVDGAATELWSAPGARILGGPDVSPDGQRVAFSVEQGGTTLLYVVNADGTNARVINDALRLQGAPSWAPDGRSIASGAVRDGRSHLFRIPLEGAPQSVIEDVAIDPAWSPAGDFLVYSAADIGTEFAVKAVTIDGRPHAVPAMTLTRGARRLRFYQGRRALIAMRGDIRHKDLWLIDLDTGASRQLTQLPADFNIRDFDVSADGEEIVVERVQEHSDIVLIDRARRP